MKKFCTTIAFIVACFFIQACASSTEIQEIPDPIGLQGHVSPQAEQAFAKADVLWRTTLHCNNPELAFEFLDEALRLEPSYTDALVRRAMLALQMGYLEDALDDATKAIRLDAGSDAYAVRSVILIALEIPLGAEKDAEQARKLGLSSLGRLLLPQ